jgi:MFS family permease
MLAEDMIPSYFEVPMLLKVFQLSKYPSLDSAALRSNLRAHIMDGALFGFAMSFVSFNTILPVFIQQVGGGVVAIGSVPVLWTIGLNFPQAIFVRLIHSGGPIKPSVLRYGLLHRCSFFLLGLVTFFVVTKIPSTASVPLLLVLLFLTAVGGSLGVPPWFHLFTKTTPMKLRGRLQGVRQLLSSALGILGGTIVTFVLSVFPFPENFGLLFIIAFSFSMMSYRYLRNLDEPPTETMNYPVERSLSILADGRAIILRDKNFSNFLLADAFTLMAMSASAFYAVYAIEEFDLPSSYAGTFTVIVMAGMVVGNIVFGYLADSFGHKINLILLAGASAAGSIVAMWATNILVYGLTFVFMSWTLSLQGISRLSFVAELCSERDRPTYIALTNTLTAPTVTIGILFGWIARAYGFHTMFGAAVIIGLLATAWFYFFVSDPRSDTRKIIRVEGEGKSKFLAE